MGVGSNGVGLTLSTQSNARELNLAPSQLGCELLRAHRSPSKISFDGASLGGEVFAMASGFVHAAKALGVAHSIDTMHGRFIGMLAAHPRAPDSYHSGGAAARRRFTK